MKKYLKICSFLIVLFLFGCGVYSQDDVIKDLSKLINNSKSYFIEGKLEIINNEDTYNYDVLVSYKDGDYYKVELTNANNNHEQVILRNEDGVYV